MFKNLNTPSGQLNVKLPQINQPKWESKGEGHPGTGHEGPEGE